MARALLTLALCCSVLCSALPTLPAPNYTAYVAYALPIIDSAFHDRACTPRAPTTSPCDAATDLASIHAAWYTLTGSPASLARVSHLLLLYLSSWRNVTRGGAGPNGDAGNFFSCRPLVESARALLSAAPAGLPANWSAADVADLGSAAAQVCQPCCQQGVFNQPLSRASGLALFPLAFPRAANASARRAYAESTWDFWVDTHAYGENANVYNGIFLSELLFLGAALNATALAQDLASAPTLALLQHMRDTVGPSGLAPAYGDDWSEAGGSGLGKDTRPWTCEEAWYWPAVFERAAAAHPGQGFEWAAASYFHSATGGFQLQPPLSPSPRLDNLANPGKNLVRLLEAQALQAARSGQPLPYIGDDCMP